MTLSDLNKPAELTLWSSRNPAHTVKGRHFSTLRAALAAAAKAAVLVRRFELYADAAMHLEQRLASEDD